MECSSTAFTQLSSLINTQQHPRIGVVDPRFAQGSSEGFQSMDGWVNDFPAMDEGFFEQQNINQLLFEQDLFEQQNTNQALLEQDNINLNDQHMNHLFTLHAQNDHLQAQGHELEDLQQNIHMNQLFSLQAQNTMTIQGQPDGILSLNLEWAMQFNAYQQRQPFQIQIAHNKIGQEGAFQNQIQPFNSFRNQMQPSFQNQIKPLNNIQEASWSHEFEKAKNNQIQTLVSTESSKDALAATAGLLLQTVENATNLKFKESKFLNLMKQFRDGDVAIEGDKVVNQIAPSSTSQYLDSPDAQHYSSPAYMDSATAQHLDSQYLDSSTASLKTGPNIIRSPGARQRTHSVSPSFMQKMQSKSQLERDLFLELNNQPNSMDMAEEFTGQKINRGNWEEEFGSVTHLDEQNFMQQDSSKQEWKAEFNQGYDAGEINQQNQGESSQPFDQGWDQEFANQSLKTDWTHEFDSVTKETESMPRETHDWAQEFKDKLHIAPDENDIKWLNLEKQWSNAQSESYSIASDPRFTMYTFTAENPYMSFPMSFLADSRQHHNVTESILALEAAVQKDPSLSSVWQELGMKQQENENDYAAIAALRKAVDLDSNNLDALLYLSVSYTNENYTNEAYDALQFWIERNPKYSHLAPKIGGVMPVSQKHELISNALTQAAVSSPGEDLDEHVQTALGVLFNISTEYTKAIDCFRSALSKRPHDYQLWNKLGATLANSNDAVQATEAYFNALEIKPDYIRARYNLAIACIQLGQYHEAAEHLLGALSMQQRDVDQISEATQRQVSLEHLTGQSTNVWSTLRLLLDTYVRRDDLVEACDQKDLGAFRNDFDF